MIKNIYETKCFTDSFDHRRFRIFSCGTRLLKIETQIPGNDRKLIHKLSYFNRDYHGGWIELLFSHRDIPDINISDDQFESLVEELTQVAIQILDGE